MPKSRNSGSNPEESFPRQRNVTIPSVAGQRLDEPLSATVNPGYRGIAGVLDTTKIQNSSETLGVAVFYRGRLAVRKGSNIQNERRGVSAGILK
jgi:hypothetical protein